MDGCALPTMTEYATPIGNLQLDVETISQLRATGQFTDMSVSTDEDEHSIEMHLPYIRKVFQKGTRFQYTFYYTSPPGPKGEKEPAGIRLSRSQAMPSTIATFPIHASIEALDREALAILTLSGSETGEVKKCHDEFSGYLIRTKNTICGRHPIGVLIGALGMIEGNDGVQVRLTWVSYASAYVVF
ncbi:hypothetical protein Clacol_003871 [Clathrus columnatus]|uniref:Uncharacterized protein n=1 Tax=Clathrus columnatus TaxID=1419009 RepID=A0AAV5A4Y1_9AGAM|nr:hypothetical protein Clacol_003871 [Clathrus columnatus]